MVFIICTLFLITRILYATTYNTPTLDGNLSDWAKDELIDANDCNIFAPSQASYVLYITWDATNLYIGIDRSSTGRFLGDTDGTDDSLFVAIDTDQINGSGAGSDNYGRVTFDDANSLPEICYCFAGGSGWYEWSFWDGSSWDLQGWFNNGTYYGWNNPGNENDELSIPWLNLGYPTTIRLYLWITQEADGFPGTFVEDVFPLGNPTGINPSLTLSYQFTPLTNGQSPQKQVGQGMISNKILEIDFSIDLDNGPPFGISNTDIFIEAGLSGDSAQDDFYFFPISSPNILTIDENIPILGGPIVPALNLGAGSGEDIDAYCFGLSTFTSGWFPELEGAVISGDIFVQFTVNPDATGLPLSAVAVESAKVPSEEGGDVFESIPIGGSNAQLADETALGLSTLPENDINSLVIPDGATTPIFNVLSLKIDTNGDSIFDAPLVFFSVKSNGLSSGDDILMTPTYTGSHVVSIAWPAVNLGLPGGGLDEIDALFVEDPFGMVGGPFVYFSLAPNSSSLNSPGPIINSFNATGTGADPGDIIAVQPSVPAGAGLPTASPIIPPTVSITAGTLGLYGNLIGDTGVGEDDLNGVHFTTEQLSIDDWTLY